MATCETCKANKVCDHNKYGFENCNNYISADVLEVRHGEWEQNPYCKRIYFCSECGRHIEDGSFNPYEHFPYCHCGAKMGGERRDT